MAYGLGLGPLVRAQVAKKAAVKYKAAKIGAYHAKVSAKHAAVAKLLLRSSGAHFAKAKAAAALRSF
jgi:hypothetical protein